VPPNADEPSREAGQALVLETAPPATAQLAWRLDPETEEVVLLEPGARPYLVGREFDCDVLLDADLGVSRRHAQVSFEEGSWWLADLGSKNGTRASGILISGRSPLSDGVSVSVGRTDLRFELLD
jgi:pSer/pThr/pTyr-binding forkhead associated (FHA) protein